MSPGYDYETEKRISDSALDQLLSAAYAKRRSEAGVSSEQRDCSPSLGLETLRSIIGDLVSEASRREMAARVVEKDDAQKVYEQGKQIGLCELVLRLDDILGEEWGLGDGAKENETSSAAKSRDLNA